MTTTTPASTSLRSTRAVRRLRWAAVAFTVAVLFHNGDHARRGGDSVGADLFAAGTAAMALEVALVVLVMQRNRFAPLLATVAGYALTVGYVVAHVLPRRTWVSDPLFSGRASPVSQAAALLEIGAAVALGTAGLVALRNQSANPRDVPRSRPLAAAIREPAVIAMAVGNVVLLAVSIATL